MTRQEAVEEEFDPIVALLKMLRPSDPNRTYFCKFHKVEEDWDTHINHCQICGGPNHY